MKGRVPSVQAAETATKRKRSAVILLPSLAGRPSALFFHAVRRSVMPGMNSRIAATAVKESWKEMSKRAAGDTTRIAKAASARVLKRSLPAAHQDREEQGQRHEQGPHRRHAEPRDEGVEDNRCEGEQGRELLDVEPQKQGFRGFQERPDEKEGDEGDDPHVEARNGDDVGGPRPVEPVLNRPRDLALLPEGHGLDEGPLGEGGLGTDAVADPGAELLQGLPCGITLPLADQDDLPGVVYETPHPDPLKPEVALIVEGAGVPEAPGVLQARLRPDEIADLEKTRVLPDREQQFSAHAPGKPFARNPRGLQYE